MAGKRQKVHPGDTPVEGGAVDEVLGGQRSRAVSSEVEAADASYDISGDSNEAKHDDGAEGGMEIGAEGDMETDDEGVEGDMETGAEGVEGDMETGAPSSLPPTIRPSPSPRARRQPRSDQRGSLAPPPWTTTPTYSITPSFLFARRSGQRNRPPRQGDCIGVGPKACGKDRLSLLASAAHGACFAS